MSAIRKISKKLRAEAEYGVDGVKFIAIVGVHEPKSVVCYSRTGRIRNRRRRRFQVVAKHFLLSAPLSIKLYCFAQLTQIPAESSANQSSTVNETNETSDRLFILAATIRYAITIMSFKIIGVYFQLIEGMID